METILEFRKRVADTLSGIDPEILYFNEEEFWMIRSKYDFLQYYAEKKRLFNTAVALPVARGLHNGSYRKNPVMHNGVAHRLPYFIHCLTVTKMLADMWLPIENEEEDIMLAAAICHDMIEDIDFPQHGEELYTEFHLDKRVYDTVKLVSKRKDFTLEEEQAYFHGIEANPISLLIKLSDRGHNVTDLYNMSERKIHEYIGETRTYFLPMCDYGREHYPELEDVLEIMQDQIICLTKTTEMMAERHDRKMQKLMEELMILRKENMELRKKRDEMEERLDHE